MPRALMPRLLLLMATVSAAAPAPLPAAAQAGGAGLFQQLEASGQHKLLLGLLPAIKFDASQIPASLPVTVLAPTDAAINAFLQSMNLTYGQLQARPALVDSLLSYHIVPRVQLSGAQLKAGAPPRVARSVNPAYVLRFGRAASGAISVTDVQNRTAAVVGPARSAGKHTAYSIDRVLLNGDVFTSAAAFLAHYKRFSGLASLLERAGLAKALASPAADVTLFAPTNAALNASAKALASLGTGGALTAVLQYHVLPGSRALPAGLPEGKAVGTLLQGHSLSLDYGSKTAVDPSTNRTITYTDARVVPEAGSPGKPARVTLANVFAGQATIHGIDGVLLPKPAGAGAKAAGRRHLLRGGGGRGFGGGSGFGRGVGGGWRGDNAGWRAPDYGRDISNTAWGLGAAAATGAAVGAAAGGWGDGWGGAYPVDMPVPVDVPVPVTTPTDYSDYDTNNCYNC